MSNSVQHINSLFCVLTASEKGYLKKHFKIRMDAFAIKKSEQLLKILTCPEQNYKPVFENEEQAKEAFHMLVQGLEEYHKSDTAQVRSLINQAEILLEKNLNSHAEKVLLKAAKIAAKEKNNELLSEVIEWQMAVHSLKPPNDKNMRIYEKYFGELETILQKQIVKFEANA